MEHVQHDNKDLIYNLMLSNQHWQSTFWKQKGSIDGNKISSQATNKKPYSIPSKTYIIYLHSSIVIGLVWVGAEVSVSLLTRGKSLFTVFLIVCTGFCAHWIKWRMFFFFLVEWVKNKSKFWKKYKIFYDGGYPLNITRNFDIITEVWTTEKVYHNTVCQDPTLLYDWIAMHHESSVRLVQQCCIVW